MIGQYPTPLWMAEAMVERHFPQLDLADMVLEPTCGRGPFLSTNRFWREKVRQIAQQHYVRRSQGRYALCAEAQR